MRNKDKPIIVAVSSDHHAGSTVGLCPPVVKLPDGDSRRNSVAQRWLWRNWNGNYIPRVKLLAAKYKTKYIAILNGDAIEGNPHRTTQVVSRNETVQMRIAEEVLSPLLQKAEQVYFIRGTPAHVGKQARLEEKVAENWTNTVKDGANFTRWHLSLDVNGTLFDIGHKGSIGRLPWTRPNSVNKIAGATIIEAHQRSKKCPNVVLRAHWHQYADSGDNFRKIRVIAMPAWQLITGYVNTISPGALADIGGLIFTCWPDKTYDLEVVRFFPKPPSVIRIRS
jgi:hypothetical protein